MKFEISPAPVVEYNLFPYSESTRRQLRFLYKIGYDFVRYREETIYDKMKETLFGQSLSATLEIKEPWGIFDVEPRRVALFPRFQEEPGGIFHRAVLPDPQGAGIQRRRPLRTGPGPALPGARAMPPWRRSSCGGRSWRRITISGSSQPQLHLRLDLQQRRQPAVRECLGRQACDENRTMD